jgi:uncharacterized Zn finger protein
MSFGGWKPYVPVAKRRAQAAQKLAKLQKQGQTITPVVARRTIAASFWGKSWCDNLERYSDYANRLPRGRTYIRNGSVVDLQIGKGQITAKVAGSELYSISITIAPVAEPKWKALAKDCAGNIDSVVELLQGKLAKGVMDRVCRQGDGLFPAPKEITLSCNCPDWADMCKHVAATLYGVGARLDEQPELLFALRGVDQGDLIASAATGMVGPRRAVAKGKVLADADMAAMFGLDMVEGGAPPAATVVARAAAAPKRRHGATANATQTKIGKATESRKPAKSGKTSGARVAPESNRQAKAPKTAAVRPRARGKTAMSRSRSG